MRTLGWAKIYKSDLIHLLAWAHMPIGMESPHIHFRDSVSSQNLSRGCQTEGVDQWRRANTQSHRMVPKMKFYYTNALS